MNKHIFSTAATNVLILIALLLQGVYLARLLGAEGRGELALYLTTFNLLLGLLTFGIRQSSSKIYSNNELELEGILSKQNFFLFIFFPILLSFFLVVYNYIVGEVAPLYLSLVVILWMAIYGNFRSFYALSTQAIHFLNLCRVIVSILPFIMILIIGLFIDVTVVMFINCMAISYMLYCITSKIFINKHLPSLVFRIEINLTRLFDFTKKGLKYSIPLLLYGLNFKVDQYVVSYYHGDAVLGIYNAGVTFAELVWQIPSILSLVIFSHAMKGEEGFRGKVIMKTKVIMTWLFPLVIFYSVACLYGIELLYGEEFSSSGLISVYLMPGVYSIVAFNLLNAEASGRGLPSLSLYPFSIGLILNLFLNILFVPEFGMVAAAISSSCTYILSTVWYIKIYKNS
jgi:O-antigen/teichoic acid export membrane protein